MKATKIVYWSTTSLLALMMTYSAYLYITDPQVDQGFRHLGFPAYFRIELAIAKLIGAALLLVPVPSRLKEWAYAGFAITFISAFIAHVSSGDPISVRVSPLVFLLFLITSYISYHKLARKSIRQTTQKEMIYA